MSVQPLHRSHGGPDALGPVRWDFSTNANAADPCPQAVQALAAADASRYPDARYCALRERLAAWHKVDAQRILLAASASEFIQRITAVGAQIAPGPVAVPALAYGDYAVAARAFGRAAVDITAPQATLRWCADPGSPMGRDAPPPPSPSDRPTVLDLAYAPLRLSGKTSWTSAARDAVFQLYSPNKALGLPGVRGAYVIAPAASPAHRNWSHRSWCDALENAQPSWPLGAHAVALLQSWTEAGTQTWLAEARTTLCHWTAALRAGLADLGLEPAASVTPFLCARQPGTAAPGLLQRVLREKDLAVRDTASFGLPGWMRVSAQPPQALRALLDALRALRAEAPLV